MKIVLSDLSAKNAWNFRRALCREFLAAGHVVVLIAESDSAAEKFEKIGVRIRSLGPASREKKGLQKELGFAARLFFLILTERPDLVLSFTIRPNSWSGLATRTILRPSVATITGLGCAFLNNDFWAKTARFLLFFGLKRHHAIVFQNQDDLNFLVEKKVARPERAFLIRGSGVDTNHFSPQLFVQKNSEEKAEKVVALCVARRLIDKGIREFFEAARILKTENPSLELRWLGGFDDKNPTSLPVSEFEKMKLDGAVVFLEPTDDVRPALAEADFVVLPSYREGLPKSILEAMGMQKPVLVASVAGCREVVEEGENGFFFEPKNARSLADSILEMSGLSAEKRSEMGKKSRIIAETEFSEARVVGQYFELIERIFKK